MVLVFLEEVEQQYRKSELELLDETALRFIAGADVVTAGLTGWVGFLLAGLSSSESLSLLELAAFFVDGVGTVLAAELTDADAGVTGAKT